MGFPYTDFIKGYTAGILDGEGCISISKPKCPNSRRGYIYTIRIVVTNTNETVLKWLQSQYGGTIHVHKKYNKNQKLSYDWRLLTAQAGEFLQYIAPYLMIKKPQAEVVLKLRRRIKKHKNDRRLSRKEYNIRESLYLAIKELNKKGIH